LPVLAISLLPRTGKAGTLFRMKVLSLRIVLVRGARQAHTDDVMVYYAQREVFPANIIANIFNFASAKLFLIPNASERATPDASFT
jgi:LemA family